MSKEPPPEEFVVGRITIGPVQTTTAAPMMPTIIDYADLQKYVKKEEVEIAFRAGRLAGIEEAAKVAATHELDGPGCSCVAAADECFAEIAAAIRKLAL